MRLYLGLVHHPIKNKLGELVTTSVTNLDIHDIARSCRTFGVKKYFIVTPFLAQRELVDSILGHWESDTANAYNPDRQDALAIARAVESIEQAVSEITAIEGQAPMIAVTGANFDSFDGDVSQLTKKIEGSNMPCFLLFGTGWGLHPIALLKADFKLSPIISKNADGYNHLSVRSAVAIYLDRMFGS
ncbi:MAG: RNA methyltransferase [Bacteriovorax sp.]|jgi:hypothetical protein